MLHVNARDDVVSWQVAEQADFCLEVRLDIFFATTDNDFRVNAELVQITHGHLCGLGFLFVHARRNRDVGEVYENRIVVANFVT